MLANSLPDIVVRATFNPTPHNRELPVFHISALDYSEMCSVTSRVVRNCETAIEVGGGHDVHLEVTIM
jgi:hypothetical protein